MKKINRIKLYRMRRRGGSIWKTIEPDGTQTIFEAPSEEESLQQATLYALYNQKYNKNIKRSTNNLTSIWLSEEQLLYLYTIVPTTEWNVLLRERLYEGIQFFMNKKKDKKQ